MKIIYHRLHIPSQKEWIESYEVDTLMKAYEDINNWNRASPGLWQYWTHGYVEGSSSHLFLKQQLEARQGNK